MKVITTADGLFRTVIQLTKKSKTARISTFGLWAGIKANGQDVTGNYPVITNDALRALERINTKMIIGRPVLYQCTPGCPHCANKHKEQTDRIGATMGKFMINYKIFADMHGKYYIFDKCVIVGGMNFTSSTWTDYMFVIEDDGLRKRMVSEFNMWFNKGE